ncbi:MULTISPECIES: hypothetical protein [Leptospira]|uniref:hypothetical protein n=1 Tax=Leptospira TaxID=171 RepID=UPI0003476557|nr:hypothetical protein [Leptospira interrogans]
MNVPKNTIRKYESVTALLYSIRKSLFFDNLTQNERKTLEDYKNTLEPERVALRKAIETDESYFENR